MVFVADRRAPGSREPGLRVFRSSRDIDGTSSLRFAIEADDAGSALSAALTVLPTRRPADHVCDCPLDVPAPAGHRRRVGRLSSAPGNRKSRWHRSLPRPCLMADTIDRIGRKYRDDGARFAAEEVDDLAGVRAEHRKAAPIIRCTGTRRGQRLRSGCVCEDACPAKL